MTTTHEPEATETVTLPEENEPATEAGKQLAAETSAAEAQAEKKRKTRSDAGYPRKGGFYCLISRDLPPFEGHPEASRETVLLTDNDEAVYFDTIEAFKAYVATNVKVNESYQPVQTVGKPWGLIVGETAPLL